MLIKVEACGVCHSELFPWDKKLMGWNIQDLLVTKSPEKFLKKTGSKVSKFVKGDKVALWTDGKGYAEAVAVDEKFIFKLDEKVPYEEALAEPIGCTTNGVIKAKLVLNDTIALVGTGFMGLIMIQELKLLGPKKIIAIDVRDEMLDLALNMGADIVLNPKKDNVQSKIKELTEGKGVDVGFEVGGNTETLNLTARIV